MLEDPSDVSKRRMKANSQSKLEISEKEQKLLQKLIPLPTGIVKKKRRTKQPNPLSCKKKKSQTNKKSQTDGKKDSK